FTEPQIELIEKGPVRATWAINTRWGNSTARQEITIYRDLPTITGRVEIDWHEDYRMVKLAFPFNLEEANATFSVPFGHSVRPAAGQEEPMQQWLDVTGKLQGQTYGVAVLNDCKYGADVHAGEARISVLRSPFYGAGNRLDTPPRSGDQHIDQGYQEMRWALVPHAGAWQDARVVQVAQDFNEPLSFVREYAHPGTLPKVNSFLAIDPPDQVVVTALKQAEDSTDWVLRLYEPNGRPAEATIQVPLLNVTIPVKVTPHQIKTYRIGDGVVKEVNFLEE
ncbi:MAG: glycoside hydrolase family 38 C-terminal domain-containing protein, partial [Mycobacterium leprae]